MAKALNPDAIVSTHADGAPASGRGFHVNYSSPPLNDAQMESASGRAGYASAVTRGIVAYLGRPTGE